MKITNIRNERSDIPTDSTDMERVIKDYCEQLYYNKFGDFTEWIYSLKDAATKTHSSRNK